MKISIQKLKQKDLKPVIINADSNFVVVTYWWGKGNLNISRSFFNPLTNVPNSTSFRPCSDKL